MKRREERMAPGMRFELWPNQTHRLVLMPPKGRAAARSTGRQIDHRLQAAAVTTWLSGLVHRVMCECFSSFLLVPTRVMSD
ncbi:MAG: hypothetical protein DRO73_11275 [Candidatus Thorarchaeota archaeon]|nr:MAG: hypothetical protein DRO73_11275 [Candidatus Thorarchaeota archaeon]